MQKQTMAQKYFGNNVIMPEPLNFECDEDFSVENDTNDYDEYRNAHRSERAFEAKLINEGY